MTRPIIFSGPMIRALLDGRKTMTRRIVNGVPPAPSVDNVVDTNPRHQLPYLDSYCSGVSTSENPRGMSEQWCWWTRDDRPGPQFKVRFAPGDLLLVKETWARVGDNPDDIHACPDLTRHAYYRADEVSEMGLKWRSPIYMPRWASRLTLKVTGVKVERVQDISEGDATAEGMHKFAGDLGLWGFDPKGTPGPLVGGSAREAFGHLWDYLHHPGPHCWNANPFIAAISFDVIKANIDAGGKDGS